MTSNLKWVHHLYAGVPLYIASFGVGVCVWTFLLSCNQLLVCYIHIWGCTHSSLYYLITSRFLLLPNLHRFQLVGISTFTPSVSFVSYCGVCFTNSRLEKCGSFECGRFCIPVFHSNVGVSAFLSSIRMWAFLHSCLPF